MIGFNKLKEKSSNITKWFGKKSAEVEKNYRFVVLSIRIAGRLISTSKKLPRLILPAIIVSLGFLLIMNESLGLEKIGTNYLDFVIVCGGFLIFSYAIFVIFLIGDTIRDYKFDQISGIKYILLDSYKILILSLYLGFVIIFLGEKDVYYAIAIYTILYTSLSTIRLYSHYKRVNPHIHLEYAKRCLDDYEKYKENPETIANIKMKTFASIILLKEKLKTRFNEQFKEEYSIDWLKIDNIELLARELIWVDFNDNNKIAELKSLLDEGIRAGLDVSPNVSGLVRFMDRIKEFSNNEWTLDKKLEEKTRANLYLTVIPLIIAIINIVGITLKYFFPS